MKKNIILVVGLIFVLVLMTACGEKAPKPVLSEPGIEEIRVEEIRVEEITWENSSTITRWEQGFDPILFLPRTKMLSYNADINYTKSARGEL